MFKKVLVANRGEIALRVIRVCRELGIKTVAVYSEADKYSLHVRFADEAICIGKTLKSYSSDWHRIISAAEISEADAIHPGDGPLAAHERFAEVCDEIGVQFLGRNAEQGGFT